MKIRDWAIRELGGCTKADVEAVAADYKAKIHELIEKHESFVKWHETGYDLAHRKDGTGVSDLIREILLDVVHDSLGDSSNPAPGVSRADVLETVSEICEWSNHVACDVMDFCEGIAERNATATRWGVPNCKCGVKAMMGMAAGRIDSPLGRFARIWRKEHPDTRQKDVLSAEQKSRWAKLDKTLKDAVNVAVNGGFVFWK